MRYFGELFDSATIAIELSGEAKQAFELFNAASPGFVMPQISTTKFRTLRDEAVRVVRLPRRHHAHLSFLPDAARCFRER